MEVGGRGGFILKDPNWFCVKCSCTATLQRLRLNKVDLAFAVQLTVTFSFFFLAILDYLVVVRTYVCFNLGAAEKVHPK